MIRTEKPLTTGDIAKYCHVTHVGVVKWIKSGKLKAYATPGGHYRIEKKDFMEFLNNYKMPVHEEYFNQDRPKILIVDDHDETVDLIKRNLLKENKIYEIESASDGYEAGLKMGIFKPNLVILDLVMPRVDGFEVCRRIKSDHNTKHIKVLAITGYDKPEYLDEIMDCGADACLKKPFEWPDFLKKIRKLLDRVKVTGAGLLAS